MAPFMARVRKPPPSLCPGVRVSEHRQCTPQHLPRRGQGAVCLRGQAPFLALTLCVSNLQPPQVSLSRVKVSRRGPRTLQRRPAPTYRLGSAHRATAPGDHLQRMASYDCLRLPPPQSTLRKEGRKFRSNTTAPIFQFTPCAVPEQ
jgi:hypothetical protein